jgi:TonB family protein
MLRFPVMLPHISLALLVAAALPALGQAPSGSAPGLPGVNGGVFASYSPSYDYSAFKPWHLKASYQLGDDEGKPAGQGTYEYWWVAPQVYRSTWTRGVTAYTEWHTADGRVAYQGESEALSYFERKLGTALVSPLTASGELDPAKFRLDDHGVTATNSVVSCFNTVPVAQKADPVQAPAFGIFPTYCFNTKKQFLLGIYSFGTLVMQYNDFTQFQGKALARIFSFREGTRYFLTARIEETGMLSPSDPALVPPEAAKPVRIEKGQIGTYAAERLLVKKVPPAYPQDAKDAHVEGTVVLQSVIGIDGRVRDLQILSAPSPSLAFSAFRSVSQRQYKPCTINGEPTEMETTIGVIYSLGK